MKSLVVIYTLSDPVTKEVRYVGKTIKPLNRRLSEHLASKSTCHRVSWIKSLLAKELIPEIEEISVVGENDWVAEEKFYISYFRFIGFRLTNMTDGGESVVYTKDVIDKISAANTGKKHTDETKRKISELNKAGVIGMKGKKRSPESNLKTSKALNGRKRTDIEVANMIAGQSCRRKPVIQLTIEGDFIREWESISCASRELGFSKGHIIKVCKGSIDSEGYEIKTAYGYKWVYKNQE